MIVLVCIISAVMATGNPVMRCMEVMWFFMLYWSMIWYVFVAVLLFMVPVAFTWSIVVSFPVVGMCFRRIVFRKSRGVIVVLLMVIGVVEARSSSKSGCIFLRWPG